MYQLEDFSLDLRKCISPHKDIWVCSGRSTCAPVEDTAIGVEKLYSPPFAAPELSLNVALSLDGHEVLDTGNRGKNDCGLLYAGGEWRPDRLLRKGTYHYHTAQGLLSAKVISRLYPMADRAGFVLEVQITNRLDRPMRIIATPVFAPGAVIEEPLDRWEFTPPHENLMPLCQTDSQNWENEAMHLCFLTEQEGDAMTAPQESVIYRYGVCIAKTKDDAALSGGLCTAIEKTKKRWADMLETVNRNVARLHSDIPGLENYYKRSLLSGMVSLWESPDFVISPFPATSGMDGGSICCYPWDVAGYSAEAVITLMGKSAPQLLRAMLHSGIDQHISMSLSGSGLGWCSYFYSMWSIMELYWKILTICDTGWDLYDEVRRLFLQEEERLPEWENLKDYGRQHNLLEMRTCGYEYFVPSPNAERAWCYDRLADIAEELGKYEDVAVFRQKAVLIRKAIAEHLWDKEKEWFVCLHPEGHREYVYSIQCYDPMRMGACTEEMKTALLSHLKDGAFLGKYGVSSVSAEDELHYELNDSDWSGAGSYTGEGPNLAEALWKQGEAELAWDVLSRHFWMGEMLLYFPQEHACDRPGVPIKNKRANIIAGVAGMQALLGGMAGLEPQLCGSLVIDPKPPAAGKVTIENYRHKDRVIAIEMEPGFVRILADGAVVYEGKPKRIELK